MQDKLPSSAVAAPETPATRAWLSLVGMPKSQARQAHSTMETIAAHRAVRAALLPPEKAAMEYTVSATEAFTDVTHSTPRKLHTAARSTALRKGRAPVTTAPAMALGASVQPLTSRTARVSRTVPSSGGLI